MPLSPPPSAQRLAEGNLFTAQLGNTGRTLVVAGSFGLRLHDPTNLREQITWPLPGEAETLGLAPDGSAAALVLGRREGGARALIWRSLRDGTERRLRNIGRFVQALALHGEHFVFGTLAVDLVDLDMMSGRPRWHDTRRGAVSLAISPDGRTLAAGAAGRHLALWDPETGERRLVLRDYETSQATCWTDAVAFSPDGRLLASGTGPDLELWEVATGRRLAGWRAHEHRITEVAFSHDAEALLTSDYEHAVRSWTTRGERLRCEVAGRWRALGFGPDDLTVLLAGPWGLRAHDRLTGAEVARYDYSPWRTVQLVSLDSGGPGRAPMIWALHTGALFEKPCLAAWTLPDGAQVRAIRGAEHELAHLRFSADHATHVTIDGGYRVRLRDARDGTVLRTFEGEPTNELRTLELSPDGSILVVAGARDTTERGGEFSAEMVDVGYVLQVFEVASGRSLFAVNWDEGAFRSVRISPDGKHILLSSERWVRLYSREGKLLQEAARTTRSIQRGRTAKAGTAWQKLEARGRLSSAELLSLADSSAPRPKPPGGLVQYAVTEDGRYAVGVRPDRVVVTWRVEKE